MAFLALFESAGPRRDGCKLRSPPLNPPPPKKKFDENKALCIFTQEPKHD